MWIAITDEWLPELAVTLCYCLAAVAAPSVFFALLDFSMRRLKKAGCTVVCVLFFGATLYAGIAVWQNTAEHTIPRPLSRAELQAQRAKPAEKPVYINGKAVVFGVYQIDGADYYLLRDIALALNGTERQFDIRRESETLNILSGFKYSSVGTEFSGIDLDKNKVPAEPDLGIAIDGASAPRVSIFEIDDNIYVSLFELAKAMDFFAEVNPSGKVEVHTQDKFGAAAKHTKLEIYVDENQYTAYAYTIYDGVFLSLRDMALMLNKTKKQFDVGWDEASKTVLLLTGERYTDTGDELREGDAQSKVPVQAGTRVVIDGERTARLNPYTIDGNTYIDPFLLGEALDFYIASAGTGMIEIDTSREYEN